MRLVILTGLFLLTGSAAHANCQPASAEKAMSAYEAIREGKTSVVLQKDNYLKWSEECPTDPFAPYVGAMVWFDQALTLDKAGKPSDAFQALSVAWKLVDAYESMPAKMQDDAYLPRGQYRELFSSLTRKDVLDSRKNPRQAILEALLTYARLGHVHPFLSDQNGKACLPIQNLDAMTASAWIVKTKVATPAALGLIDRAVHNCGNDKALFGRNAYATRAKLRLKFAEAAKTPEEVLKWVELAKADANAFLRGEKPSALWLGDFELDKLTRLEIKTRFAIGPSAFIPRSVWFDPTHLALGATKLAIAAELDRLWGEVPTEGDVKIRAEKSKPYLHFISALAKEAEDAGVGSSVKPVIYEAAKGHAEGLYRSVAHKDKPTPYEFAYSWLKPKP